MERYELLVIGGGPGGYLAAERGAQAGLKTAIAEERSLGGVCLNEGCVPTKTFLNSAKLYSHAVGSARFGVTVEGAAIDHGKVVDRKNTVVKQLIAGVAMKMKKYGVTVYSQKATIVKKCDEGFIISVGSEEISAKNIIIATGSQAIVPPIPGAKEAMESGFAVTSREILDLKELPQSLCVIGGGVIGMEFAAYYTAIGVKVTVVEMLDKIAGGTDREISAILQKNYQKKGVAFKLGCKVTEIGDGFVEFEEKGEQKRLECGLVLLSIGRRAVTGGCGADEIGVATQRGAIITNERMETSVPGIWAVGDCNGKIMLAHTAYREAEVAVNNIAGKADVMDYSAIPSVIYTDPEVACCGMTMESAQEAGINVRCASISLRYSGRYLAEVLAGDGICKLIIDEDRNILVGVHIIGSYASEMIYGAAMMIGQQMDIEKIKKVVFPHPTVCEVIREGLFE